MLHVLDTAATVCFPYNFDHVIFYIFDKVLHLTNMNAR